MDPQDLLAHADFVRALARRLVFDEHGVDDLVQQTFLAALQNPPRVREALRSWLHRVVRNFAFKNARSEHRRTAREQATAVRHESVQPTEEIVAHEELRRSVVETVLGLKEPYRSTLLFRFYRELPLKEIARLMEVPEATVKTRIRRGLDVMRKKLDRLHEGNRDAWSVGLLAWLGVRNAEAAAGAAFASTVPAVVTGALIMSAKMKCIVTIVAVALITASVVLLNPWEEFDEESTGQGETPIVESDLAGGSPSPISEMTAEGEGSVEETRREFLKADGPFLSCEVLDKATGKPVKDFLASVVAPASAGKEPYSRTEPVQDEDGRFQMPLPGPGRYFLTVSSPRYQRESIPDFTVTGTPERMDLRVELDPGRSLSGRVIDEATHHPVAHALVLPLPIKGIKALEEMLIKGTRVYDVHTRTDEEGLFTLSGLSGTVKGLVVVHPDYAEAVHAVSFDAPSDIEVLLFKGPRIFGQAVDDHGQPASRLLITFRGDVLPFRRPLLTDARGRFRSPPLRPGTVYVRAENPPPEVRVPLDFTAEWNSVELKDRDVEIRFGPSKQFITWKGRLYGENGKPVTEAELVVQPRLFQPDQAAAYGMRCRAPCDEEGRFEMGKLLPGAYRLEIWRPGDLFSPRTPSRTITFEGNGVVERDVHLKDPGGLVLAGQVVNAETGVPIAGKSGFVRAVRTDGITRKDASAGIDQKGGFVIRDMEPGTYSLRVFGFGFQGGCLTDVRVEPGANLKDLLIPCELQGKLILTLCGFQEKTAWGFRLYRFSIRGERIVHDLDPHFIKTPSGDLRATYELAPGRYRITFSIPDKGYWENVIEIWEEGNTKVAVRSEEFYLLPGSLAVEGTLLDGGGFPAPGKPLFFEGDGISGLKEKDRIIHTRTDMDGCYRAEGFKPGPWYVKTEARGGITILLGRLDIPSSARDSVRKNFQLGRASIKATLRDRETGALPCRTDGLLWTAFAQDVSLAWFEKPSFLALETIHFKDQISVIHRVDPTDGLVRLTGLVPGSYCVVVRVPGYGELRTAPFTVGEESVADLGILMLEPCGTLHLVVKGKGGRVLNKCNLSLEGRPLLRKSPHPKEGMLFHDLTPGEKAYILSAEGYRESLGIVNLDPGRVTKLVVELEKK